MMFLLIACAHRIERAAPCPGVDLAAAGRARAVATAVAGPVSVPFTIRVRTAAGTVNAQGALVAAPPSSFRIEISGPIGPPQVVVASDGEALAAYVAPRRLFVAEPALDDALAVLSGGALTGEGVVSMLMGVVPTFSSGLSERSGPDALSWRGEEGASAQFSLDCVGALTAVSATGPRGNPVVEAHVEPGEGYPESLRANLAPFSTDIEIAFGRWRTAAPSPASFQLSPPPGFTVVPLGSLGGSEGRPPSPPQTPGAPAPTP